MVRVNFKKIIHAADQRKDPFIAIFSKGPLAKQTVEKSTIAKVCAIPSSSNISHASWFYFSPRSFVTKIQSQICSPRIWFFFSLPFPSYLLPDIATHASPHEKHSNLLLFFSLNHLCTIRTTAALPKEKKACLGRIITEMLTLSYPQVGEFLGRKRSDFSQKWSKEKSRIF